MNRNEFLKTMALMPFMSGSMHLKDLNKMTSTMDNTDKMPVFFLGHGSSMNAIEGNEFVSAFKNWAKNL